MDSFRRRGVNVTAPRALGSGRWSDGSPDHSSPATFSGWLPAPAAGASRLPRPAESGA
jgi:hypothetical protein